MSDAIFITNKAGGLLKIGDKQEIDRASWRKPRGITLTPTSRFILNKLFPKREVAKYSLVKITVVPSFIRPNQKLLLTDQTTIHWHEALPV